MSLESIAYGPDELVLLTIDERELLAYDAQSEAPKWKLSFPDALVAVAFVSSGAIRGVQGQNPFRTTSSSSAAVVLDARGRLHIVDTALGQTTGAAGEDASEGFGKPSALATTSAASVLAIATADAIHVWRSGERTELPLRVRALAFSTDGRSLAAGTDKGEIVVYAVGDDSKSPLEETYRAKANVGTISDVAAHPSGSWLIAGSSGLASTSSGTTFSVTNHNRALRVRFDTEGKRVAIQHADRSVVIQDWKTLSVLARIEYIDRPIRGVAFGPDNWLGIAIDHGDANKVDLATSTVHRTDTHPDRTHRSWRLYIHGSKQLNETEEEELRRIKSLGDKKPDSGFGGARGRIGIGAMISIALLGVRVCVRAGTTHTPSTNFSNYGLGADYKGLLGNPNTCNRECAATRLDHLREQCQTAQMDCAETVASARTHLLAGRCAKAKETFAKIPKSDTANPRPLFDAYRTLAEVGLEQACLNGVNAAAPKNTQARLTHLKTDKPPIPGALLSAREERLPRGAAADSETAEALWAGPDESIFVLTRSSKAVEGVDVRIPGEDRIRWRTKGSATWKMQALGHAAAGKTRQVLGRNASDVYVLSDRSLHHFDGKTWAAVPVPNEPSGGLSSAGVDLFVMQGTFEAEIQRVNASQLATTKKPDGGWQREALHTGALEQSYLVSVNAIGSNNTLWMWSESDAQGWVLRARSTSGTWTAKPISLGDDAVMRIAGVWVAPGSADLFLYGSRERKVMHTKNGGDSWTATEMPGEPRGMWGRSATDVYALTDDGVLHFDGKEWLEAARTSVAETAWIGGTPTEVLLLDSVDVGEGASDDAANGDAGSSTHDATPH